MNKPEKASADLKLQFGALLKDDLAATYVGTTKSNMKTARHTGLLWGQPAPEFVKIGRTVRYKRETLDAWLNQFAEVQNTSQPGGAA